MEEEHICKYADCDTGLDFDDEKSSKTCRLHQEMEEEGDCSD